MRRSTRGWGVWGLAVSLGVVAAAGASGGELPAARGVADGDAPACGSSDATEAGAESERLIRGLLAGAPAPDSQPDVSELNNRGYNYGPPPGLRFDPLPPERQGSAAPSAR